jgi:hypothetical protein
VALTRSRHAALLPEGSNDGCWKTANNKGGSPERKFTMKESKSIDASVVKAEEKAELEAKGKDSKHKNGKSRSSSDTADPSELDQLLSKISAASKVLNSAAGDATRRIEAVEERLLDAEPGVAVWSATLLNEKANFQREDGAPEPAQRLVTLGFARAKKDKWGICIREELKVRKGTVSEEVRLLRKADRNLRILALPHLEQLTREVLAVLEEQITVLDAAREAEKAREAAKALPAAPESELVTTAASA